MKKFRVLLTGGGTGGHIFPLIAVAEELQKQAPGFGIELNLRYFGADREYAQILVDKDIDFVPVITAKWRRYFSILNFLDIIKFPFSVFQLLWKIFWFMPGVVFSKGGPGALAVTLVSRFYLIPVVIHESDSAPGLTNKISGRWAQKIYVAFASASQYFTNPNLEVVGNPIRSSLLDESIAISSGEAKKELGFNANEPLLLVLGGSQGAEKLNNFVLENLELLIRDFQVLHQVGNKNYLDYKNQWEFVTKNWSDLEKNRYRFQAFFEKDFSSVLAAADLALARAGAGTIFELAATGKPAILVPIAESANNHQKQNAYFYSKTGAALVIEEENLLGNLVTEEMNKLFANPPELQKMADAARSFYRPEAAIIITKHLLTYIGK